MPAFSTPFAWQSWPRTIYSFTTSLPGLLFSSSLSLPPPTSPPPLLALFESSQYLLRSLFHVVLRPQLNLYWGGGRGVGGMRGGGLVMFHWRVINQAFVPSLCGQMQLWVKLTYLYLLFGLSGAWGWGGGWRWGGGFVPVVRFEWWLGMRWGWGVFAPVVRFEWWLGLGGGNSQPPLDVEVRDYGYSSILIRKYEWCDL